MNSSKNFTVTVSRRFAATPERVFDAWLDPKLAEKWLFTSPSSQAHSAQIDARVGGSWTVNDTRDGTLYAATGEYLEIRRPSRLVFSFGMPQFSPEFGKVAVDIQPERDGCLLTLTQEVSTREEADGLTAGWSAMFEGLAVCAAPNDSHGFQVSPASIRFERLLPGPIERVWAYITESDKRAQWLGAGVMPQQEGAHFEIFFHHKTLSTDVVPTPARFKEMEDGIKSPHKVLRCEPPHLLKITWGNPAQPSEVTFELIEEGSKVRLVLTHALLSSRGDATKASGGWHAHLSILIDKLEDRMPPSFWTLFAEQEPQYEKRYPQDAAGSKA